MTKIEHLIHRISEVSEEAFKHKSENRNLKFVNRALHLTCSDLNNENLELKIQNETLRCEIDLLKGEKKDAESRG